jgi:hypothetical protein
MKNNKNLSLRSVRIRTINKLLSFSKAAGLGTNTIRVTSSFADVDG